MMSFAYRIKSPGGGGDRPESETRVQNRSLDLITEEEREPCFPWILSVFKPGVG